MNKMRSTHVLAALTAALLTATLPAQALAAKGPVVDDGIAVSDPFESLNRGSYDISTSIDNVTLRPVAKGYLHLPSMLRTGVGNVLSHISTPTTLVNALLQGNMSGAATTLVRFSVNTIAGFGGIYDFAGARGVPAIEEDFGQTLGVWGVGEGPYVYIPLMGPSNVRDITGRVVDVATDPLTWVGGHSGRVAETAVRAIRIVDTRADVEPLLSEIQKTAVDPYATVRSVYTQSRRAAVDNGVFNPSTLPDFE